MYGFHRSGILDVGVSVLFLPGGSGGSFLANSFQMSFCTFYADNFCKFVISTFSDSYYTCFFIRFFL